MTIKAITTADQTVHIDFTTHPAVSLQIFSAQIIRVCAPEALPLTSHAVIATPSQAPFTVDRDNAGGVRLQTSALHLHIDASGHVDVYDANDLALVLDYRGQRVPLNLDLPEDSHSVLEEEGHAGRDSAVNTVSSQVIKALSPDEHFYGLGDKTGFIDKRGYEYDNWNTDDASPHLEHYTKLYKSVPILYGLREGRPYGLLFDNAARSHLDLGKENPGYYYYSVAEGPLDYYVIGGPTLASVVQQYTQLTGPTPLPQRWTLGYQQSRFGWQDAAEVSEIAATMRRYHLPCDVLHLDIDYMAGYRVFTWNSTRYPQPAAFVKALHQQGFKLVTIIDPGVKAEPGYSVYDDGIGHDYFVKMPAGQVYTNRVWPGQAVYPDFGAPWVRQWWGDYHARLTAIGVDGIWNDMNEPAGFDGPLPDDLVFTDETKPSTHAKMHNLFGHNMSRATYAGLQQQTGRRPFVITRAAYAGTQRYATVWAGDNQSLWVHLQMMVPQLCNLALSGFSFAGTDIGGFGADTTPELLIRWIEGAIFSPLLRNHSAMGNRRQEPWVFGEPTLSIYRKYLELRYRLIPYLYDLFAAGEQTGAPVMRPLVYAFDQDPAVVEIGDQYMVGDALMVAPVLEKGKTSRLVYLPAGEWIDFWTGEHLAGGQEIRVEVPLDALPLFGRVGTMVPMGPKQEYLTDAPDQEMDFRCFGDHGTYRHYQDDGSSFAYRDGAYNLYQITVSAGVAAVTVTHAGDAVAFYREIRVRVGHIQQKFVLDKQQYCALNKVTSKVL
ncbi:glycoside hydrolase family 31 protein [Lacticaseibacillus sp. N501-2]|uniref:glycoside hydrolase family 31 protein n=1 Tax=Lacticaseibacillus salsurae TaxID=3367729 RepID=UPI0038B27ABB